MNEEVMAPVEKNIPSHILDQLIGQNLLTENDRSRIKDLLANVDSNLDEALCNLGIISEEALAEFFASEWRLPRLDTRTALKKGVPLEGSNEAYLRAHRLFPFEDHQSALHVATANPLNQLGLRGLEFAFGEAVKPVIATASEIEALFAEHFAPEDTRSSNAGELDFGDDAAKLKELASAEPAIRLLNRLIKNAGQRRASDIHFEPAERVLDIRFRIDGVLSKQESLSKTDGLALLSRLKILSNLDIAERRRPQDGRFTFTVGGKPIDLRVSTSPTIFGESAVVRLLETTARTLTLHDLGFSQHQSAALHDLAGRPNGIIMVTGPTGSGKTTTLYALLESLRAQERKILTVEDPVEYKIAGVSQTQVNPAIDLTFASAMRSFLRHDPDVILVGEMRDLETARTAVQAALTGHLVLSTLHTNDAPSAITRLLDMGVDDYLVASTLNGILAQRLVRVVCTNCRGDTARKAECDACGGAGYRGRTVISELLIVDDRIKALIRKGVTAAEIKAAAEASGFAPLTADGASKEAAGVTDRSELQRVIGA